MKSSAKVLIILLVLVLGLSMLVGCFEFTDSQKENEQGQTTKEEEKKILPKIPKRSRSIRMFTANGK